MPDFQHHVSIASGFLELGLLGDAANELEEIEPDLKCHPDVISVRMGIYDAAEKWETA